MYPSGAAHSERRPLLHRIGIWYADPSIHKIPKFHAGMDFTSKVGTPIHATGDGKVTFADYSTYGYDVIGLVGNSGLSSGPHLHYEVHKSDEAVDPANYYFNDLTPEEYARMLEISRNAGQSLD